LEVSTYQSARNGHGGEMSTDKYDEKAERILTQFPDDWSPSCKRVCDAVAAELRRMGREIIDLKSALDTSRACTRERDARVTELRAKIEEFESQICPTCGSSFVRFKEDLRIENAELRAEIERLTALIYDES
jgi:hypothetical protein